MFSKEITTTAEDYRSLVSFTEFTLKKSNNIICIIAAAVAVAVLVIGLAGLIPLYVSGAVGAVCACVILVTALLVKKKADDGIKYGKVLLNAKRTFRYDTQAVRVFGGRTDTDISFSWNTIFKIYETEKYFFIYFRYDLAYCLPKDQLTMQEALEVRNYFIKKMEGRFVKKCK